MAKAKKKTRGKTTRSRAKLEPVKGKRTAGRPRIEVDWETVDQAAALHCTAAEIALLCKCCDETLDNRCKEQHGINISEYIKQKSGVGKTSLRRRMWKTAEGGNVTMQIWLAKNWLGMTDRSRTELTGANGGPVAVTNMDELSDEQLAAIALGKWKPGQE